MIKKLAQLFSWYPAVPGVHPRSFATFQEKPLTVTKKTHTIAFQSVPDKFYFLLFGVISSKLAYLLNSRVEVVVVRSISGATGTSWVSNLKRSSPFAWLSSTPWVRAYGSLIDGVAYRCASWKHPLQDWQNWQKADTLWKTLQQQGEHQSLVVNGIDITDLLIDSYLRFKPSPRFNVTDPFVKQLIWQALRDVHQAHVYFSQTKPCLYLTSYTTYLEHGIPARVALHHGTKVWSFGNLTHFGKQLTATDNYHTADFSHYKNNFEKLDNKEQCLDMARQQIENRLSGGIDAATSYMRQSAYAKLDTPLPPGLDGAVIIFLHDFYDSPHVYPDLVFQDFWQWVCFTIDVLEKNNVSFFLKPHPNQISLSDEALNHLKQKYPKLQWLSSGISNVQLAQAGIACGVTVYGTVAHELAYLGIPSIGCARHPHHTFGFCRTAHTRQELTEMLETYAMLPLPKEEMQQQALAFYYMHNIYGASTPRDLQHAFVTFWKTCNQEGALEINIQQDFNKLIKLPAFTELVETISCCNQ